MSITTEKQATLQRLEEERQRAYSRTQTLDDLRTGNPWSWARARGREEGLQDAIRIVREMSEVEV